MKILICLLLVFHASFGALRTANDTSEEPSVTEISTSNTTTNTEAPSSSIVIDASSQQLFNDAVSSLIEVVKTKLNEKIDVTLSDAVVNAIAAPDNPALVRKNTKVNSDTRKSTDRLEVPKGNRPGNHKSPAQKPNKATSGTRGKSELHDASEDIGEVADDESEPTQIDDVESAVDKSEIIKDLEAIDEVAEAKSDIAQIDDAEPAAGMKLDDQQRTSRARKQSSKKPSLERQASSSNAVMVGFNEITVDEIAFKKTKGQRARTTVTIKSTNGPISVLLSSNLTQVPVASYSISAPIVIQIGLDNTRSQNNVIVKNIKTRQLKTIDLKIDDALKNKSGIILDEIKQLIRSANFDQKLQESFTAALQDETVVKKFMDASNSNLTQKRTKI